MGKPAPPKSYRDDPDAVSMHTTPDEYEYSGPAPAQDGFSSYIDSEATANPTHPPSEIPAHLDFEADPHPVVQPSGTNGWRLNSDIKTPNPGETTIRMDDRLTEPSALHDYITDYLRVVPPRPTIRIQGWHTETVRRKDKKEKERVCDFDVLLSLQHYFRAAHDNDWWGERTVSDSETTYRGGWRKTRAPGHKQGVQLTDEPTPTLLDWCEAYCASPSRLKVFRINRVVSGLNTALLRADIESLILKTHYRGHIDIGFPIEQRRVDIYYPHLVNRWRNSWIRYLFYFTFLWLFTWPVLYFLTKWWDVYTVEWRWSRARGDGRVEYARLSERQWFAKYQGLIRELVVNNFQGDASSHESDVAARGRVGEGAPSTGNAKLDGAIGVLQGGFSVWNAVANGRSPADQGWGYDR